jgi:hypothetical protein
MIAMRGRLTCAWFAGIAGATMAAVIACGNDAGIVGDPGEGGATGEGGADGDDASAIEDGATFDVILFEAGTPCDADPTCDRRIAFITSNSYMGAFGGLTIADALCMTEAQANPLLAGRTFRAWLSTNGTNARARFPAFTGALRRVDGEIVAVGLSELLTTGPRVPINRPPSSTTAISSLVWTGTSADGGAIPNENCTGWMVGGSVTGGVGKSDDLPRWTSIAPDRPCGVPLRIYCIER